MICSEKLNGTTGLVADGGVGGGRTLGFDI